MNAIETAYHTVKDAIQLAYDKAGEFLDKNPALYKVVLVASHFFRAVAMFGVMMWAPIPMAATVSIMIAGTLLYRAAVERFCCFRFAIPSMVGAGAAWLAHLGVINFISGQALASVGLSFAYSLTFLPLLGYIAWVIYLSHADIEKRASELAQQQNSCCCSN